MDTKEAIEKINKAGYIDIDFRKDIIETLQRGEVKAMTINKNEFDAINEKLHEEIFKQMGICGYEKVLTILKCFQIIKKMQSYEDDI